MAPDPHMDRCTVGFDRPRLHHSREGINPVYLGMLAHLVYSRFASSSGIQEARLAAASALHHVDRNLDVAPCSVGIGTCLAVRRVHDGLGDFALQTWHADVEPCPEEVNVAGIAQVYFGIDGYVSGKRDLHPSGHKPHRTDETGGPTSGKQLLRIRAGSRSSGSRELHIQAAIITVGDAATPTARSMGLGGVPHGDPFLG